MISIDRRFAEVNCGIIEAKNWLHIPLNEHPFTNIDQALKLSDNDFKIIFGVEKPLKSDEIIFYCMAGIRSDSAAQIFHEKVGCFNLKQ